MKYLINKAISKSKESWALRPRPINGLANWFRTSKLIEVLDGLGKIFIIAGILAFVLDLVDRQSSRAATAWELVTNKAEGNSGKIPALEYLNQHFCPSEIFWGCRIWPFKKRQSLAHLNLSSDSHNAPVYLAGINLENARLEDANLTEANLSRANLSSSLLDSAFLCGTDLSNANLTNANLTRSILVGAILDDTDLTNTDLAAADLREVTFITSTGPGTGKFNDCNSLKKARNWELSIRSKNLSCGKPSKSGESLTEVIQSCRFGDVPDHLARKI